MDKAPKSVDQYIAAFPEDTREKLQQLRHAIKTIIPNAEEKISYGIPTFFLVRNLVHYAAFKNHIGLYALPDTNDAFADELRKYKTGKGSIQFPLDEDLPIEFIKKLIRYRIQSLL